MAEAASNQSPPNGDQKPQAQDSGTVNTAEQQSRESLTQLISANIQPMREEQVQNAVKFLSHPKVRGSPVIYRRSFLEKKGLTREEIDEAFRRVPDPPPSTASVDASAPKASQQSSPVTLQPQAPSMAMTAPAAVTPVLVAPTQRYKFQWSHALFAIGILAASGAGTAVVFKNVFLPRLKNWIRKVSKEKDDVENIEKPKPDVSEDVAEAAKQAAAAAAIVAKTSQDLLLARHEDRKYFETLKELLDVQVEELKFMRKAVGNLEGKKEVKLFHEQQRQDYSLYTAGNGTTNSSDRISYGEKSGPIFSSVPEKVNGSSDKDSVIGRPSSAPASAAEPTGAPYSKSYMDIMAMIQRGETPPGIKEVNDMPPNPSLPIGQPRIAPRAKPWELMQQEQQSSSYANGRPSESLEPSWDRKIVKITEMEFEKEEGRPSYGVGSSDWRRRGWVPPQPPSVAIPEAAVAIRQPKASAQKQQVGKDAPSLQNNQEEDESFGPSGSGEVVGTTFTNSAGLVVSEIQEEPVETIQP